MHHLRRMDTLQFFSAFHKGRQPIIFGLLSCTACHSPIGVCFKRYESSPQEQIWSTGSIVDRVDSLANLSVPWLKCEVFIFIISFRSAAKSSVNGLGASHVLTVLCQVWSGETTMRRKHVIFIVVVMFFTWNMLMYFTVVTKSSPRVGGLPVICILGYTIAPLRKCASKSDNEWIISLIDSKNYM